MSVKKRGLGRGLSDLGLNELLTRMSTEQKGQVTSEKNLSNDSELKQVEIDLISPGKYQPRRELDQVALEELAESIKSQGIIQPIVIRWVGERYEIVAGERRWRAAKLAGLQQVPALVKNIPDEAAIAVALIENIQREDLNAIEEAMAFHRLMQEFSLTHQQIATIVGKSRATISNLLRLLSLPTEVKNMLERRELEMGHARSLLSLDEIRQIQVAKQIVLKGMSVRETEAYIRRLINLYDLPIPSDKDEGLALIEKNLSQRFGARVTIKARDDNKGKLIVHYKTRQHLETILDRLATTQEQGG
jgi:ParB family chromosome partitioning protein